MKKKLCCYSLLLFSTINKSQTDSLYSNTIKWPDSSVYTVPIFSTGGSDAESELDEQDASSLLQSSRDLFTQSASFQFGAARYRMRGYPAENSLILINGVSVNNPETGSASWSSWGGLNDVTRYTETRFGTLANRYGFSGAGGYTNIDSKASSFKKGTRISYGNASRIFRHRLMVTHSSGILKNGWAITISASSRYGNEVNIKGTYFSANAFYLSIDKQFNDKHLLSFTGFIAPTEKALSGAATLEAYELSQDHFYNALWGYQNGKKRNASISRTERPTFLLSHHYKGSTKKQLSSTLFYTFGKSGITGLNFNNAPNPKPDYYKYLPSYFYLQGDSTMGYTMTSQWQTNVNTRQINWDQLIALNKANLYTLPSQVGSIVNTDETRARYILENKLEKVSHTGFNVLYNERKDNLFLSAGANGSLYKNEKYKEVEDLLGATFWIDVDQFAQNLGVDPLLAQNNIEQPDRKVFAGERFGYDYSIHIQRLELWGQAEYTAKKIDVYAALSLSGTQMWRNGKWANGKFPLDSKGNSEKASFSNYGFKAGSTYKLNGRNFMTANILIESRAPEAANTFVSPRVRNDLVQDIQNEEVSSLDLNYLAKYPNLKLRFTLYRTQVKNQTWLRTYWDDTYNTNVNLIMTNVNQHYSGMELGIEKTISTAHGIQVALGLGQFIYSNQPRLQAWQDNNNTSLYFNRKVYLKNYRIGGSPQLVSSFGYKYNAKKLWFAGINVNYLDQIYIEPNPDRRTEEAAGKFQNDEKDLAQKITGQEKLKGYFLLNANAGKSFRLKKKKSLTLNFSVNNLLNNTHIISSGYEQLRWDQQQIQKFPNKYYYMTGITYMLLLNFSF